MAVPVLLTKVILPHRSSDLLTRQRLVEEVEESLDRKLILVVAPAGYGKTSLLIDVAHRHEFPFCWYSQERTDNDLSSFLTHLIACIEQRFSGFGEQSRAALIALDQGNLTPEQCETVIVNELYDSITEHFVIVLDDYQMVSDNAEINHFVNRFVQDVDQNCHIVILSRKLLSLADLPLMVARSQASGIGVRELAFLPDEIKSLMLQNYHQVVSDAAAQELAQQTEGWITGLLLSAQTMRGRKPDQLQYTSSAQLYDYLANQVLDQQTPEVRDFLLQTAFMEEFNADLCQEFLGPPPAKYTWKKMMEMVVRQNLFVLLVEKEGFWLRYHQLFSDFLQDRLCQDDPQRAYQLQKSLVNSYSNHQQWQKAYAICLSLGDLDTTADFLERTGELMIRSGRVAMLKNWLEALPASLIAERPGLLARLGIVLATQGDTQRGLSLLNQAARQYIVQQNEKHLARVLAWRALVHYLQARWEDAVADAKEVLKLTQNAADDESLTRSRAEAYRVLGQYSRLQGNFKQSISQLSEAQKLYQSQLDTSGFNVLQMSLGASYGESGDISSAQTSYFQALEYYQSQGDLFSEAAVLNDMAVLQHMKGEYSQAFTTFEQALDTARRGSNIRVETMIYIGMGDLFIDLDVPDTALEAYYHARDRVVQSNDNFLNIYQHIAEASANRLKMDFSRARNLLNTAEQLMGLNPLNYTHALWLLESGQLEFAEEYFVQAREEFAQAARLFESIDQHILAGRAYLLLGGVHFALNNLN
jgi:LuxR family maltose regulon positive regulatory protein